MRKIRVLVVDDAVVVRRMLTDVLAADPDIEVVGTAPNGRIGLQKISQVNPDLVTLDVEMPELDGLATVVEIRKTWPRLPVLMFSTLTERGAGTTLDALARGASDYVTKPANVGSVSIAQQRIRDEVIPKVKALAARVAGIAAPNLVSTIRPMPSLPRPGAAVDRAARRIDLLAIGASTGGPNALQTVLADLPEAFPVPIVVTQHMPPMFTRLLAERLTARCRIPFHEATDGAVLTPGAGWIAPGDWHLLLVRDGARVRIELTQDPPENSCRPAVDPMFRTAAAIYGAGTFGVVLTGMGQDGLRGAEQIRGAHGRILVQDEATSVVWGMPGFIASAGLADAVLPLDRIAGEITRTVAVGRRPFDTTTASAGR